MKKKITAKLTRHKETEKELIKINRALKQKHVKLKESEEKFRVIFENSPDGIILADIKNRTFCTGNPAICRMLGYNLDELLNLEVTDLHPKKDLPYVMDIFKKQARQELIIGESLPVKRKDGTVFYANISGIPVTFGGKTYMVGIFRDITERVEAEQKLLRQKDLLDGINEIFKEVLRDKTEEDLAKRCLDVAQKLTKSKFGIIEEINDKNLFDVLAVSNPGWDACDIPIEKAKKLLSNLEIHGIRGKIVTDGKTIIADHLPSHPSSIGIPVGHPSITTFMGVPLKYEDKIIGEISVANKRSGYDKDDLKDIEALGVVFVEVLMRKRAEENLKQLSLDVMQSNQDLERFATVISHDLQEPLVSASNFIQLFSKRYGEKLDKDAGEFIEYAISGMKWMNKLINDLLEYSRLSARGKAFERVNTENSLKDALKNLDSFINKSSAVITYDKLPIITGDPVQITQLFQNLISNSLKFAGMETPKIHISVGAKTTDGFWQFCFKDNGIGFEPEHGERIFGVFTRLHTRGEYSGTGIGLAICKKIIERHRGKIWADSKPGKGASFYFTLPN